MRRTEYCGAFTEDYVGKTATAMGWVQTRRDMGGIIFVDIRDREGTLQVVFDLKYLEKKDFQIAERLKNESVIEVSGIIRIRDEETYNPRIGTGTIEMRVQHLNVLSEARPLPFPIDKPDVREDLRLKYRFLDIRRPEMIRNLKFRHAVQKSVQAFLDDNGFIEVETPILTKSTPEGARDYLVPSRVHPGMFYALPQSPQIFKQLLMVGGIDKYYQVARCFRDEDLRADRQPEFTQVDMELSFVEQEDILVHLEKLFRHLFLDILGMTFDEPFPRMTWQEAMDVYGSDKPDLRFGLPIVELTELVRSCSFGVFRSVCEAGGVVRAINVKGGASFTRTQIEELTKKAMAQGAKGMAWIAVKEDGELYSILTKYLKEREIRAILKEVEAAPGDFVLFCADKLATVRRTLGCLRQVVADMQNLREPDAFRFLFVVDFPQFEYSQEEGRYVATHHPFTMPYPEDIPYLLSDPGRVRAQAYDVVLNGIELGSGSMRIYDQQIQQTMFEALGFTDEQIKERFGFMVDAFQYGTPPHGGFAFGLDRLVMQMLGADSLREVTAFPKTKDAACLMTQAPNVVDEEQLEVLGMKLGDMGDADRRAGKKEKARSEIDVDKVAKLSRLSFSEEEKRRLKEEMGAIINFADQLSELDTSDFPMTAHVVPVCNVLRADVVCQGYAREELLANAPRQEDGYLSVPRVVE